MNRQSHMKHNSGQRTPYLGCGNLKKSLQEPRNDIDDNRHQKVVFSIEMLEQAVKRAAQKNFSTIQESGRSIFSDKEQIPSGSGYNSSQQSYTVSATSSYHQNNDNLICEDESLMRELDTLQQNFPSALKKDKFFNSFF